ncbi:MAG: hypothetical protein WD738_23825 [Pirellulales bacterium]
MDSAAESAAQSAGKQILLPRFSIRVLLAILTIAAVAFLIAGMAYRGQYWAWGVTIGLASLVLTALVHAAWFGVVWLFAQMPTARAKDTK